MTQVRVHHKKNFSLRSAGARHNCASQSELCSVLFNQADWLSSREIVDLAACVVRGMIVNEQNFQKRNSACSDLRNQWLNVFLFVQSRNDDRDGAGTCREICHAKFF